MKTAITLLALMISANSFAIGITFSSCNVVLKEPAQILEQVQNFHLSGDMGPALSQQVLDLQKQIDVSDEEAVDFIAEKAEEILR